jgi:hypothetical protein
MVDTTFAPRACGPRTVERWLDINYLSLLETQRRREDFGRLSPNPQSDDAS